jgi:hypothetical protein
VGRIRLAPRLPAHLRAFRVDGVGIGDARLSLEYTRDGSAHLWRVEPSVAPVPPLLVFEPRVGGPVASVRVDGAPAELEVRRSGAASVVPVQLPVDGPRTVEIVTGEP